MLLREYAPKDLPIPDQPARGQEHTAAYMSRPIYAIPRAPGPMWVPMVGPTQQ